MLNKARWNRKENGYPTEDPLKAKLSIILLTTSDPLGLGAAAPMEFAAGLEREQDNGTVTRMVGRSDHPAEDPRSSNKLHK